MVADYLDTNTEQMIRSFNFPEKQVPSSVSFLMLGGNIYYACKIYFYKLLIYQLDIYAPHFLFVGEHLSLRQFRQYDCGIKRSPSTVLNPNKTSILFKSPLAAV